MQTSALFESFIKMQESCLNHNNFRLACQLLFNDTQLVSVASCCPHSLLQLTVVPLGLEITIP